MVVVYYRNKRVIFNEIRGKGKGAYFKENKKGEYGLLF